MPKILVVDDEAPNVEIASRMLQMHGYEVVSASNGPDGVAAARTERPDLILMDLSLPNPGDGLVATRAIRAQAGTEAIPVIALTAAAMAEDQQKAYQAGCNEFESKPIDFRHLLDKIQKLLAARRGG